jgi:hypothetical protein
MKHFNVTRLDRRHKAYKQFTFYIQPVWSSTLSDKLKFFEWRKWCWETWGPGMERDQVLELGGNIGLDLDPKWAWHLDKYGRRLYFATDKELNWFLLTWSSE